MKRILSIIVTCTVLSLTITTVNAMEVTYVRTTGYTDKGLTASGTQAREGVIAGPASWLGRECWLVSPSGDLIGSFVFEDTGNPKYVHEGRVDIYFEDIQGLHEYQKTVGDYAYIVWR